MRECTRASEVSRRVTRHFDDRRTTDDGRRPLGSRFQIRFYDFIILWCGYAIVACSSSPQLRATACGRWASCASHKKREKGKGKKEKGTTEQQDHGIGRRPETVLGRLHSVPPVQNRILHRQGRQAAYEATLRLLKVQTFYWLLGMPATLSRLTFHLSLFGAIARLQLVSGFDRNGQ